MDLSIEDRIRRYWKRYSHSNYLSRPQVIMEMAKKFERPCAEIRRIVGWPSPESPGYIPPDHEEKTRAARKEEKRFERELKWAQHNLKEIVDEQETEAR